MNLLQVTLISLLGYLTYIHTPFLGGGLIGWYCIGRPLVSALFIGLILGDVKNAMILGTYVQLIFIGLVTPGGSITPDMNLATFIAIPLGVVAHLDSARRLRWPLPPPPSDRSWRPHVMPRRCCRSTIRRN